MGAKVGHLMITCLDIQWRACLMCVADSILEASGLDVWAAWFAETNGCIVASGYP